jgi:hypothetical protein
MVGLSLGVKRTCSAGACSNTTSGSGNWQRGRELIERAMVLNPRHPGFLWYPLVHDAYRQKDYSRALDYALRVNLPGQFWTHLVLAMVHGQLGNRDAAARALEERSPSIRTSPRTRGRRSRSSSMPSAPMPSM